MVLDRRSPWKLKMDRGVAGIVGRITGAILPRETLLVGPRVEEGAIHCEMLVGEQPTPARREWISDAVDPGRT